MEYVLIIKKTFKTHIKNIACIGDVKQPEEYFFMRKVLQEFYFSYMYLYVIRRF